VYGRILNGLTPEAGSGSRLLQWAERFDVGASVVALALVAASFLALAAASGWIRSLFGRPATAGRIWTGPRRQ
jgi:hypothetical protein